MIKTLAKRFTIIATKSHFSSNIEKAILQPTWSLETLLWFEKWNIFMIGLYKKLSSRLGSSALLYSLFAWSILLELRDIIAFQTQCTNA